MHHSALPVTAGPAVLLGHHKHRAAARGQQPPGYAAQVQGRVAGPPDHDHVCKAAFGQCFQLMGYVAFDVGEVAFYAGPAELFGHFSPQVPAIVVLDKGGDRHGEGRQICGRRHMENKAGMHASLVPPGNTDCHGKGAPARRRAVDAHDKVPHDSYPVMRPACAFAERQVQLRPASAVRPHISVPTPVCAATEVAHPLAQQPVPARLGNWYRD